MTASLRTKLTVISLSMLVLCLPAEAQRSSRKRARLKFAYKATELSGVGLKIKLLDKANESPAPPPTAYRYRKTVGTVQTDVDMFAPSEVWFLGQLKGRWTDGSGNSMTLATIKSPLPKGFPRDHVEMPHYEAELAKLGGERNTWTEKEMREWVADFLDVSEVTSQIIKSPSFRILKIYEFQVPGKNTPISYAFQLNPKAASVYKPDGTWFFISLDINPSIRKMEARQIIASSLLTSISAAKKASTSLKSASSAFQSKNVAKVSGNSAEFQNSKKRVAQSISNMKNWWYAETRNYIFLSDLGIRHKVFIKSIQEEMEGLRAAYVKIIPPQVPIKAVSVVRVFSIGEDYENYVGPDYQWSGGLWMASKKEMIIRSPNSRSSKFNRDVMRRVVYHEGFHQYLYYSMDQVHSSAWFNEGHAVFFENGVIKSRYFYAEEDESYIKSIDRMMATASLDIPSLIKMNYQTFYDASKEKRSDNYALAWGLIYYLRKYAPLEKPANYTNILNSYVEALWKNKNAEKATEDAFKNTNTHNLTRDFVAFWKSKNKRGYAKRNLLFK